jgi:hypothetical protein
MNLKSIGRSKTVVMIFARAMRPILPDRDAIGTPVAAQRPTRHGSPGYHLPCP